MNELKIQDINCSFSYMTNDTENGFDYRIIDNIVFVSNDGFAVLPKYITVRPYRKSITIRVKDKIKLIDSNDSMAAVIKAVKENGIAIWQGGFNAPWSDLVDEYTRFSPFILVSIENLDFSNMKILKGGPNDSLSELLIPVVLENTRLLRVVLLGEEGKKFWNYIC